MRQHFPHSLKDGLLCAARPRTMNQEKSLLIATEMLALFPESELGEGSLGRTLEKIARRSNTLRVARSSSASRFVDRGHRHDSRFKNTGCDPRISRRASRVGARRGHRFSPEERMSRIRTSMPQLAGRRGVAAPKLRLQRGTYRLSRALLSPFGERRARRRHRFT